MEATAEIEGKIWVKVIERDDLENIEATFRFDIFFLSQIVRDVS